MRVRSAETRHADNEREGVSQRCFDEIVERRCRSISEGGDESGIDTAHPHERHVPVKVGGMDEPEAHRTSSRIERPHPPCDSERSNVANIETGQTLSGPVD